MIEAYAYNKNSKGQFENIFLERDLKNFVDNFMLKNKIIDTKDIEFKLQIDKKIHSLATFNGVSYAKKHTLAIRSKFNKKKVSRISYYIHTF